MSTPSIHLSNPLNGMTDGLIVIAKRECPTCVLIEPLLQRLAAESAGLTVYSQDDPDFGAPLQGSVHDERLEHSYRLDVEIVPTLIRVEGGREVARTYGWDRAEWERVSGQNKLGAALPAMRPGCGALNVEPAHLEDLLIRFEQTGLNARKVEFGEDEDEIEAILVTLKLPQMQKPKKVQFPMLMLVL
jgi:hypothetical protein